ncbi:MAG: asparagine synthase (glutamine-hydrolyzing) [Pseudomonadota bacterium]
MCGLIAVFSSTTIDRNLDLDAALASLNHRGPDASNIWFCDSDAVVLGHARLSIMDPEGGAQPMHTDDIHIVVNGEFYDFEEIKKDLQARGAQFRTDSDSEILIHLYRRYGIESLAYLRGEFAFVLWDKKAGRVFAARDRFGIKPLFYHHKGDHLIFASEIKAIKEMGIRLEWDEENIFNLSAGFVMDPTRSVFKGVYQIPPGNLLLRTRFDERLVEYWNYDYNNIYDENSSYSDTDLLEQFGELFRESVQHRLRADVEVGCYLSGGIDSSSVLGLAASIREEPIRAFSISFEDSTYDELEPATAMAEMAGANLSSISVSEQDLADNFADAIWHNEYVVANSHGVAKFLLSRLVRDLGCKVVLTGEGADEALAGYPHFRQDLIRHCYSKDEQEKLLDRIGNSNKAHKGLVFDTDIQTVDMLQNSIGMTPSYLQVHINAAARAEAFLSPDFYSHYSGATSIDRVLSSIDYRPISSAHPVNKANYFWNKTTFPSYVLTVLADRMEMSHSIEARLPFLDHVLFEFCQRLPIEMKIRDLTEKWILRESTKERVTKQIYATHKNPFTAPPSTLNTSGSLFSYVNDTLGSQDAIQLPFFEMKKVLGVLGNTDAIPLEQRINFDAVVMMMASLVELKRSFNL